MGLICQLNGVKTMKNMIDVLQEIYNDSKLSKLCSRLLLSKKNLGMITVGLKKSLSGERLEDYADVYIDAPCLLRGIIDSALESQNPEYYSDLQKMATDFCYLAFSLENKNAVKLLSNIKDKPQFDGRYLVREVKDDITWNASKPGNIRRLEGLIQEHIPNNDIFVISGHGAYRPGFILAILLGIEPYAIRNSHYKLHDLEPKILSTEDAKSKIEGKKVIVFDEDVNSGCSIVSLIKGIKNFKPKQITGATLSCGTDPSLFPITEELERDYRKLFSFRIKKAPPLNNLGPKLQNLQQLPSLME